MKRKEETITILTIALMVFAVWIGLTVYNAISPDKDTKKDETKPKVEVTTEVPTTEVPTTEKPTTEVPTTEAPTVEPPTAEVNEDITAESEDKPNVVSTNSAINDDTTSEVPSVQDTPQQSSEVPIGDVGSVNRQTNESTPQASGQRLNVTATYYLADCEGCIGITASGHDVRNTIYANGYRVIATDPSVIPLGSIVQVDTPYESFKAIASDTGGAIVDNRIDILAPSLAYAQDMGGKVSATVTILNEN